MPCNESTTYCQDHIQYYVYDHSHDRDRLTDAFLEPKIVHAMCECIYFYVPTAEDFDRALVTPSNPSHKKRSLPRLRVCSITAAPVTRKFRWNHPAPRLPAQIVHPLQRLIISTSSPGMPLFTPEVFIRSIRCGTSEGPQAESPANSTSSGSRCSMLAFAPGSLPS